MSDVSIFRKATEDEKKDFNVLGRRSSMDAFLGQVAAKQQVALRAYKPYCTRCAMMDYEQNIKSNTEAMTANVNGKNVKSNVDINLDSYGDIKRFELLDIRDVREDKLLDGIRTTVVTGKQYKFKCNVRGCGHTLFVDKQHIESFEKMAGIDQPEEVKDDIVKTEVTETKTKK